MYSLGKLTLSELFQPLCSQDRLPGAIGGAFSVVGWGALNTCEFQVPSDELSSNVLDTAVILGNFRNKHPGCHSIADMAAVVGGSAFKEFVGLLFIVT